MLPEFSEFSYGFALTNEFVGRLAMRAAPIFPSLIEEGRPSGGYDVELDDVGVPFYLQFKLSEYMKTPGANPVSAVRRLNPGFLTPFYRFSLMKRTKSDQHKMLVSLERSGSEVYYAAPAFHSSDQMNRHWRAGKIQDNSIFISPRDIWYLRDDQNHHVAFNNPAVGYFCSDPKKIEATQFEQLAGRLAEKLGQEKVPLRNRVFDYLASAKQVSGASNDLNATQAKELQPKAALRDLANIACRDFNAQLIIVQKGS